MPIKFGERGYIEPPKRQDLSIAEVEALFVDKFPDSTTRRQLFEGFMRYNTAFQLEVTTEMIQWIGGSFTTAKSNPRDIDVVTIIPFEVFDEKADLIETKFRKTAREEYGVDAYMVSSYPKNHAKYGLSHGILVYWDNQFSTTRKNRAGIRFKRGYIQIIHQKLTL